MVLRRVFSGVLAAVFLLAAGIGPAAAEVRTIYETGGEVLFSIAVPDGWVITTGGSDASEAAPRILGINPEGDQSLWVGFMAPAEPRDLEEAEAYVRDMGKGLLSDSKVSRVDDGKLGLLPARFFIGQGTRQDAPVDFAVAIAALPGPRAVIGVVVGEYDAREVYGGEIAAIMGSLRVEPGQ